MKSFLEEVTEDLLQRFGYDGFASLCLVFPSRRAALVVNDLMRRSLERDGVTRPVRMPEMTTLSELIDSLSPLYKGDEIQMVAKLYHLYDRLVRSLPQTQGQPAEPLELDVFYSWGRQLIQDFSNIDKAYPKVDVASFLANTAAAKELEKLVLDEPVRQRLEDLVSVNLAQTAAISKRAVFEAIWNRLPQLYDDFQQALGAYTYEGARLKRVLTDWETDGIRHKRQGKHFVFVGFNYLVPGELELMKRLQSTEQALFYWEYPVYDSFTVNPKAFHWVRRNAEDEIKANCLVPTPWQPKEVHVIATSSATAQAQYVHTWLMEHHHKGDSTGVVIYDESMLEAVLYALPADTDGCFKDINITKGFPLRDTKVFHQAMAYLEDWTHDIRAGETYAEVVDRMLEAVMREAPLFESSDDESDERPVQWQDLLVQESFYRLRTAVNCFRRIVAEELAEDIRNLRTLRLLLRRYLETVMLPFHGEPIADIQIIGALETRALDFDNLLILNAEEGIVPRIKTDTSYIPYYLRKAFGLETQDEATDVFAYNFFRLMKRAEHITVMCCDSESKTDRKEKSQFVVQMLADKNCFRLHREILTESNTVHTAVLPLYDVKRPNYLTTCRLSGTKRLHASPSAIKTYLECPMQHYLHYTLAIAEPESSDCVFTRAELGTFVHRTIEILYHDYVGADKQDALRTMLEHCDEQTVKDALNRAYDRLNEENRSASGVVRYVREQHPLENEVITRYVLSVICTDRELARDGLVILELEQPHYMALQVPEVGDVWIGGTIDRVDCVNGQRRIVDYKTGGYRVNAVRFKTVDELFLPNSNPGHQLQLLLYAVVYAADVEHVGDVLPVVYYPKEKEVCRPIEQGEQKVSVAQVADAFKDRLADKLREIFLNRKTEDIPDAKGKQTAMQVVEGKCYDFCPYKILCGRK